MNFTKYSLCAAILALPCCTACDDGRIPEKEFTLTEKGRVAKVQAHITGADSWPETYSLSIAGFSTDNAYTKIKKDLVPDAEGNVSVVLSGIPEDVNTLEVCVVNSVRRRIVSYYTLDAPATTDTIRINAGNLNVGMYATIQQQIFDKQCAHCHSGNAWAASLNLNEGASYADMLHVASQKVAGKERVTPGDADNSVLYEALASTISLDDNWKHNHANIMTTDRAGLQLIKDWIDNGAKE